MSTTHIVKVYPPRPARNWREARAQRFETVRGVRLSCGHDSTTHKVRAGVGGEHRCVQCEMDEFFADRA
jgi:hypothetical protein